MKNLVKRQWLFLFALISVFAISSCSDDEGPSNQATVDGEKWSFKHGYIITQEDVEDTEGETGSRHIIYLTGKDLTIELDDDVLAFDGEDNVAAFGLFSASNDELEEGTYVIRMGNLPGNAVEFAVASKYSVEPGQAPEYDELYQGTYGTIKVSRSGDTYTFNFKVQKYVSGGTTEEEEGEINGYFKGKLTRYDFPETETVRKSSRLVQIF